jgi:soluble lytic murein transglycosylase
MKYRLIIGIAILCIALSACKRSVSDSQSTDLISTATIPQPVFTPVAAPTNTPAPTSSPAPAARILSADQALTEGDWETAVREYQASKDFSADPQVRAAALLGLGRVYLAAQDYEQCAAALTEFVENYAQDYRLPHAYYLLGDAYLALEKYPEAIEAYTNYLDSRPGVIDAYVREARGDTYFAKGEYSQAAADFGLSADAGSTLDPIFLKMKMARSLSMAGDQNAALVLYDQIYNQTQNEYTRALIDLRKGQILIEQGRIEEANSAFMDAVTNYPQAYESYSALVALLDQGVQVDDLTRGIVDYYAGEYGVALSAFDHYLQNNPVDPATGHYYNGLTRRALGGYPDAVAQWDEIITKYSDHHLWDDAWEAKAYTQWAFLDDLSGAVETMRGFVEKSPSHGKAPQMLYEAGRLAERQGDLSLAAELWEKLAVDYPGTDDALNGLFQAGIANYRMENFPASFNLFQRYFTLAVTLQDRSRALFWIGKAQNATGNLESARASWAEAAGVDPTGYYSERARDLLDGRTPFTPPQDYDLVIDWENSRLQAEDWLRNTFSLDSQADLKGLGALAGQQGLLRGLELWEIGKFTEARSEFEELRQLVASDPIQSYQFANFLTNLGLYRSGIMATRQVLDLAGMDDATSLGAPAYFNNIRFGTYFSDQIMALAEEYNFHPLLLFSVVRQESLFEGFVQSSAGARGLMQIVPGTGEEIASRLKWPADYTEEDLYRPIVNLKFGVDYLGRQRELFEGDLFAALAAYNGGPGNAMEWEKLAPDDPDLFLEIVRFEETRNYIRGIYEIFTIYRFIYNRTP